MTLFNQLQHQEASRKLNKDNKLCPVFKHSKIKVLTFHWRQNFFLLCCIN